jgi:hypothetical protein
MIPKALRVQDARLFEVFAVAAPIAASSLLQREAMCGLKRKKRTAEWRSRAAFKRPYLLQMESVEFSIAGTLDPNAQHHLLWGSLL